MSWVIIQSSDIHALRYKCLNSWTYHELLENVAIFIKFDSRFAKDKAYVENHGFSCVLDGVILNKAELLNKAGIVQLGDWILKEIEDHRHFICDALRGVFTGCVVNKGSKTIHVFGNQTGDVPIFYYCNESFFCVSTDFTILLSICRDMHLKITLDEIAVNHLMSLGYIVEGHTMAAQIKKLQPGELLAFKEYDVKITRYHTFDNANHFTMTMEEAIERIDIEFCTAVRRSFEKDLEYGYQHHLVNMSAGLDCKMISFAAKKMGYSNITNNCYAKLNSDELQYAAAAARLLGNDFLFMPIDTMNYIYDVEQVVQKNYALSVFAASTGCNRMLSDINFSKFGLEHNGMIGDVVIGSFLKDSNAPNEPDIAAIAFSNKEKPMLEQIKHWDNHELFALYYRGFQCAASSHLIRNTYTTTVSPYMDVDFLQFCMNIPLELRCGHKLYWKWLYAKYPEIVSLPTTTFNPYDTKLTKRNLAHKLPNGTRMMIVEFLRKTGCLIYFMGRNTMKPQDEMIKQATGAAAFMAKYFTQNISVFKNNQTLYDAVSKLYGGNVLEKEMAMTILGACRVFELE